MNSASDRRRAAALRGTCLLCALPVVHCFQGRAWPDESAELERLFHVVLGIRGCISGSYPWFGVHRLIRPRGLRHASK